MYEVVGKVGQTAFFAHKTTT